ncbi:hypothetical protein B0H17DRAFT_1136658 [Mycena rosella]|uniref:Uncharacterized protein n=1 Tax=Mycena rosella TaxID=1033263 RepID=A0AAD7GFR8_MYCRO|nr:hypothetical protein B0H17DRAFT_1136658 [Mycena rosella]
MCPQSKPEIRISHDAVTRRAEANRWPVRAESPGVGFWASSCSRFSHAIEVVRHPKRHWFFYISGDDMYTARGASRPTISRRPPVGRQHTATHPTRPNLSPRQRTPTHDEYHSNSERTMCAVATSAESFRVSSGFCGARAASQSTCQSKYKVDKGNESMGLHCGGAGKRGQAEGWGQSCDLANGM